MLILSKASERKPYAHENLNRAPINSFVYQYFYVDNRWFWRYLFNYINIFVEQKSKAKISNKRVRVISSFICFDLVQVGFPVH